MTPTLNDVNGNLISQNLGERVKQVLIKQVEQFGREFNARRATATDNERQQTPTFLVASSR
jgi:hypothetical protein